MKRIVKRIAKRVRVVDTAVRVKGYEVVSRAVEESAAYASRRLFKHQAKLVPEDAAFIQELIEQAVMDGLHVVLQFD